MKLRKGDTLLVTDVQYDFLRGGSLAVRHANDVIGPLNDAIAAFRARGLPVFASRDWHPAHHCSFLEQGGIWPPHCVAGTLGAEISADLDWKGAPPRLIDKARLPEKEAYSAFEGTSLESDLDELWTSRLFVGGLTTEYCVLNTVRDAIGAGYKTFVLVDAVRAVNLHPGDGEKALTEMRELGAILISAQALRLKQRPAA